MPFGSNPKDLIVALDKAILQRRRCAIASNQNRRDGEVTEETESATNQQKESHPASSHLLLCSAQKAKSKWGTQALEERFRRRFPELRILRIDSESVSDPSHPAYGCIIS